MQTDYWKSTEVQDNFKNWLGFYEGCLACGCDHGCNEWTKEQRSRAAILFRVLANPTSTTDPNKITKIPLERIDKIWWRLFSWDCVKFNRELNKNDTRRN